MGTKNKRPARGRATVVEEGDLLLLAQRRAFHDAFYQHLMDTTFEMLKDPAWRDYVDRMAEEFAELMLRSIRNRRRGRRIR